jgi:NAD(P)-dependent dehydrogenase (short-subunit alcohol dehydrogenase family)
MKTILITGCSSGIGLCSAQILHKRGYRVFAAARKQADVQMLRNQGLESIQLDLQDSASIASAVAEVLDKTNGRLDALFNNAGYSQAGAVEDLSRNMLRDQFETNVFGLMELTNLIIPVMRRQGYGRIIQNTSILGIITMPYRGAYNASKFALEGISRTLRQELRGTGIFVSMIVPGPIHSRFRQNAHHCYERTIGKNLSIHADLYKKMEKYFFDPAEEGRRLNLPPEAVVDKLIQALESSHPRAHYYVGMPAHVFAWFRRLLPDGLLDWIIHKVTQAEGK